MKNKVNYAQAAKCYIFYHTPLRKGNSKKKTESRKMESQSPPMYFGG